GRRGADAAVMKRFLLALPRCAALVGLTAVGLVLAQLAGVLIALIVSYPYVVRANRCLAQLGRRWSARWAGVPIAAGYRAVPGEPVPGPDGFYVHNNQLFRRAWFPRYMRRTEALTQDPAVLRDWLWLAFTPFTGGLAVAVPPALLAAAVFV